MALVAAILLSMNGKPLSLWKLPIQINPLVAIFSTFARSALLLVLAEGLSQLKWNHFEKQANALDQLQTFDDASRGPWGALMYFLKMKRKVRSLAATGTALTILALAFEPFTQQILEFSSRQVAINKRTAYVSTAESLPLLNGLSVLNRVSRAISLSLPTWKTYAVAGGSKLTMLRSIINLLPDPHARVSSHFVCPAGDCEMPVHWSLAACADCEEEIFLVQDALDCPYSIYDDGDHEGLTLEEFKTHANKVGAAKYSLGFDEYIFYWAVCLKLRTTTTGSRYTGIDPTEPSSVVWDVTQPFYLGLWTNDRVWKEKEPDKYTNRDIITVDSTIVVRNFPKFEDLDKWPGVVVNRTRCRVQYCAKETASTNIKKGRIQSDTVELPLKFSNPCGNDTSCPNIVATSLGLVNETKALQLDTNLRVYFGDDVAKILNRVLDMEMTTKYLVDLRAPDLAKLMSTVISSFMRSSQNTKATNITGSALAIETYIRVQWEWVILPSFIVLASVAFLVLTVLESRSREQLFKSSVLMGYFLGWEQPQKAKFGRAGTVKRPVEERRRRYDFKGLLKEGTELRVRMIRTKEGELALVQTDA